MEFKLNAVFNLTTAYKQKIILFEFALTNVYLREKMIHINGKNSHFAVQ